MLPAGRQAGSDDGGSSGCATSLASSAGGSEEGEAPGGGFGQTDELRRFMSQMRLGSDMPGITFLQVCGACSQSGHGRLDVQGS